MKIRSIVFSLLFASVIAGSSLSQTAVYAQEEIAVSQGTHVKELTALTVTGLDEPVAGMPLDPDAMFISSEGIVIPVRVIWYDGNGKKAVVAEAGKTYKPVFMLFVPEGYSFRNTVHGSPVHINLPEFLKSIYGNKDIVIVTDPVTGITYISWNSYGSLNLGSTSSSLYDTGNGYNEVVLYDSDKDNENDEDADSDDDPDDDPHYDPEPEPTPDTRQANLINNNSKEMSPYKLYTADLDGNYDFTISADSPFSGDNPGRKITVSFFGENYSYARELSANKKYTFMIYMCGTDQERTANYRRLSMQLADLLKADMSDVNILVCVGGTYEYSNNYMEKDIGELGCGLYYVNPDGLDETGINVLANFELSNDYVRDPDYSDNINALINSSTFIKLVSTDPVDMGDPGLLAGFINFSTNLFPADNYGLSLSDHGGGLHEGVCFSDSLYDKDDSYIIKGTGIETHELESALASTDLYRYTNVSPDGKLGFLFFDACLMGSTEEANNLRNYYRYMMASQEVTISYTRYSTLVTRLNNGVAGNSDDRSIAIDMSKDYVNTEWHVGNPNGRIGSFAVFSSEAIKDMYAQVNSLSEEMSAILTGGEYSAEVKDALFTGIRKSVLSSYLSSDTTSDDNIQKIIKENTYVDIGEFMSFLKKNISAILENDNLSDRETEGLQEIVNRIEDTLNSGFLIYLNLDNYKGFGAYSKEAQDGVITINDLNDITDVVWTKPRGDGDYLYGSSLFIPFGMTTEEYEKSTFYDYYNGSELNPYTTFVHDYVSYYNDPDGYAGKRASLAQELADYNIYNKLVTPVSEQFIPDEARGTNLEYIGFKVADSYEEAGMEAPVNSTGIPMLDILETQNTIQLSAVHKQYYPTSDEHKTLVVDMICAEADVSKYGYSLNNNTIYFNVSELQKSLICAYGMSGRLYDETTGRGKTDEKGKYITDCQYVLKSNAEDDVQMKQSIIKALDEDYNSNDSQNIDLFLTVFGGVKTFAADSGNSNEGASTDNVYHVFKRKDSVSDFLYIGTVENTDDEYRMVDNASGVSVYHYILVDESDGEDIHNDQEDQDRHLVKKMLENFTGIDDGFFATDPGDDEYSLMISMYYVTEPSQEGTGFTHEHTAYVLNDGVNGNEYSDMAFLNEKGYGVASANTGNGPLSVDVDKIREDEGLIICDDQEYREDTDIQPYVEPEDPENSLPDLKTSAEAGPAIAENVAAEIKTVTDTEDAVTQDINATVSEDAAVKDIKATDTEDAAAEGDTAADTSSGEPQVFETTENFTVPETDVIPDVILPEETEIPGEKEMSDNPGGLETSDETSDETNDSGAPAEAEPEAAGETNDAGAPAEAEVADETNDAEAPAEAEAADETNDAEAPAETEATDDTNDAETPAE